MKNAPSLLVAQFLALILAAGSLSQVDAADPKKVIVVTVTTGFRHSSIASAEKAIQKLADESKAFTVVEYVRQPEGKVPSKPNKPGNLKPDADEKAKAKYEADLKKYEEEIAKWTPEMEEARKKAEQDLQAAFKTCMNSLSPENLKSKNIDGVIFANTTGDLPLPDREGFIRWIEEGHAFMGMHSAGDTFHGFPGYLDMLQGEFSGHGAQVPADLVAGDAAHPSNGAIGEKWDIKLEEMYLFKKHDRAKVRTLWHLKHHPNNPAQAGYHAVSWCRKAGKGNVFYTSLGHREDLWDDSVELKGRVNSPEVSKQFQAHILGGIKWALGLVPGSAEPNPTVQ